jgi:hypothetical protein
MKCDKKEAEKIGHGTFTVLLLGFVNIKDFLNNEQ